MRVKRFITAVPAFIIAAAILTSVSGCDTIGPGGPDNTSAPVPTANTPAEIEPAPIYYDLKNVSEPVFTASDTSEYPVFGFESAELKDGAVVSVRGYGKFIFDGAAGQTGKGRERVIVRKYI